MDGGVQQTDSFKDIDAKIGILFPPSLHNVNQVLFFPAAVVKRVHVGPVPRRDFALHDSVIFGFIERPQSSQLCGDSEEKSELLGHEVGTKYCRPPTRESTVLTRQ